MAELTATYRLQMNAGFTFAHAIARVDYFAKLGVSHLYLSPIFAARKGSMHGYDVIDPCRINPELGTEADLLELSGRLAAKDMGIILDVVPNHMGVGPENSRWDDVLAHGERSRFASWFDIEWSRRGPAAGKVVLPVLGDTLDKVLERGELSVRVPERGAPPRVFYFEQSFPLDPATLPPELQLATIDPEETGQLTELFSGTAGRDRLRDLLAAQHYRLVFWKHGPEEINYRRFFDVNDLAALRMEDEAVFQASHALIMRLVREGVVDGLRVDHIDGLRDPLSYLRRLRDSLPAGAPLFVEKILSPAEELRRSWPVDGTTGYEFMNDLEDLFLDPAGFSRIEAGYRRMRRLAAASTFHSIARTGKVAILRGALHADVTRLAALAAPLAKGAGERFTAAELEAAIVELIASLEVYRTYIDAHDRLDDADRELLEKARADAQAAAPAHAPAIAFIADVLLGAATPVDPAERLAFATRFQQVSGPAAAKGVEDTALYVYVPLVSRNEVGGAPDRPLDAEPARLHEANRRRAEHWPHALLATNTHDTKRSADVRARLDALSELSHEWDRSLRRWRRLNARHRKPVKGRLAPDTNTEYLIYQTLVALWPPPRPGRRVDDLPDRAWRDAVRERMVRYALKAAREAKTSTSWVEPASDYEKRLDEFIAAILEPRDDAPFLSDIARLVARAAPIGTVNALARVAIHLTAPGTPDIYQGDELWTFTLVDPDNRAQVDYDQRAALLAELESLAEIPDRYDNRLKLLITTRLLQARRRLASLVREGDYRPLRVEGPRAEHVFAFGRSHGVQHLVTVVPRLACDLVREGPEWWGDTFVRLPVEFAQVPWRSVLTGDAVQGAERLSVADLLRTIPVAVLTN